MENLTSAASEQPVPTGEQIHSYIAKHGIIIYNTHHHHYHGTATGTSTGIHQSGASQQSHGNIDTQDGRLPINLPASREYQAVTHPPVEGCGPNSRSNALCDRPGARAAEGGKPHDANTDKGNAMENGGILAPQEWSKHGLQDVTRLFSLSASRIVSIDDGEKITPAVTVSQELGECISNAFRAERRYKGFWTEIDKSGTETEEKKAKAIKSVQEGDEELERFDKAMHGSSIAPTAEQQDERRRLTTRAYRTREDLNRILDAETQLWGDCNLAEQACRDAWEDVSALLRPIWLRAGIIPLHPIDDTRLPKGDERGITRQIDCEPPTSLRHLRDDVKESADALRKASARFEHMCHHYMSWAPWEDGVAAEFRDHVVKPAFLDMLQDERMKLVDARNAYEGALGRAWRGDIPDAELDIGCGDELKSNETLLLDEEDAMFMKEVRMNVLEAWRRQNPNRAPSETLLYPAEEREFEEELQPWESKSKRPTSSCSEQEQEDPPVERKRSKKTLGIDGGRTKHEDGKARRPHLVENRPAVSRNRMYTRNDKVVSVPLSGENQLPRKSRRQSIPERSVRVSRHQGRETVAKHKRRPVTDFFKTSERRLQ